VVVSARSRDGGNSYKGYLVRAANDFIKAGGAAEQLAQLSQEVTADHVEAVAEAADETAMGEILEENLMDVVIPAFVISDVVSLCIGLWAALYFSRKLSVPLYRVKKWADVISTGDLAYRLKFRPGDDLKMLEDSCNQVSETYARIIDDLRKQVAEADLPASPRVQQIKSTLERLRT